MRESLLPLFLLDVVLFPGMVLPLRIFEPRYQLMVRRCMDADKRFGVVLRRPNEEPGTREQPHPVGTIAELSGWEVLPNGHIMLVCVGVSRFRILELLDTEPYLVGRMEPVSDGPTIEAGNPGFVTKVRAQLSQYLALLEQMSSTPVLPPEDDWDIEQLGYYLSAILQIGNERKQALLELQDSMQRLRQGTHRLLVETRELQDFLNRLQERGDYLYRGKRLSRN